jgi:hypothetical protein
MKELFEQILSIEDVQKVMLFTFEGELTFQEQPASLRGTSESSPVWQGFIRSLAGIREADLIFDKGRLYIRRTDLGYLIIVMGIFAPAAMVRMNCDMLLPSLKQTGRGKGLRQFLRKKSSAGK